MIQTELMRQQDPLFASDKDKLVLSSCSADLDAIGAVHMKHRDSKADFERARSEVEKRLFIEYARRHPSTYPFASLFEAYKPELWYFQVVDCVRRLALSGLLLFIYPGTDKQVLIAVHMCAVFLLLFSWLEPFLLPLHNDFFRSTMWAILLQLFGNPMLRQETFGSGDAADRIGLVMAVVASVLPLVPLLMSSAALTFRHSHAPRQARASVVRHHVDERHEREPNEEALSDESGKPKKQG